MATGVNPEQITTEPMKCLQYLTALLVLAVAMTACSSDSFKIEGQLTNLDGVSVKVIFMGDSGIVDNWVDVDKKGKFIIEGHAAEPVLVNLMDRLGKPLAMMVAVNGDHLKVSGDAGKEKNIKVKGNRLNEDWQIFRDEHKSFYDDTNPSRLDAAIEKYVREHPDDMLSTVLLLADYSDYSDSEKVSALLNGINESARPKSLTMALEGNRGARLSGHLPRLMTIKLMAHGGGFEEIKLTNQTTLIHLWANPQDNRQAVIDKLQGVGEGVRIIDVIAESDTMRWHEAIAGDPAGWKHYWAPAGPLEQDIQLLGFTSVPWFAVTDSTGLVTYSGPSLDAALSKVVKK
jgi:hypothetical protein